MRPDKYDVSKNIIIFYFKLKEKKTLEKNAVMQEILRDTIFLIEIRGFSRRKLNLLLTYKNYLYFCYKISKLK